MATEFRSEILSDGSGKLALAKSAAESDGGKNAHDVVLNSTTFTLCHVMSLDRENCLEVRGAKNSSVRASSSFPVHTALRQ